MITSFFKKSTPLNYSLLIILLLVTYFLYQFSINFTQQSIVNIGVTIANLVLIFASYFLLNFIVKKNRLTKDSGYAILFFFLFLVFFPSIFSNYKLILSNFFILLALRRLISLQTLKSIKEKIFDASLWVLVASLFHFWAILFLILVFISIIFHASRDYKNWLIPFVAFFIFMVLFYFFALIIDKTFINNYFSSAVYSFNLNYFKNIYQNISFSIFIVLAIYFVFLAIATLSSKPLNMQSLYKEVIFTFFIGFLVFLFSANKTNETLLFTFFPLAIMTTNNIEYSKVKIRNEVAVWIIVVVSFFCYFSQL